MVAMIFVCRMFDTAYIATPCGVQSRDMNETVQTRVRAALGRIAELNPSINAFITVLEADAMAQAKALDEELSSGRNRGVLHGQPMSVKDLIDIRGTATTAASRVRARHIAREDAEVVTRLRNAGAVLIGKTNMHEFALGTTSDESAYGAVRHPHARDHSPGGSSGGSAAAVAAGMGWASIGTDTGGSIRIPAAACGVVGLKPTFGEIPMAGIVPLSVSLDHVGPLAGNVGAVWAVFSALAGVAPPPEAPLPAERLRLGALGGYFLEKLDAEVRQRFAEAIDRLKAAGVDVIDVHLGRVPDIATTYFNVALTEAYAYHARALAEVPDEFTESVRTRLLMGREISRDDYLEAQAQRSGLRAAVDSALSKCDALVLPTLPIPAPAIGATTVRIDSAEEPLRPLTLRLTQLFNLTGHPAISLPCGNTAAGLPCGLQLAGRRQHTVDLLSAALSCEMYVTPSHALSPSALR